MSDLQRHHLPALRFTRIIVVEKEFKGVSFIFLVFEQYIQVFGCILF